MNNYNYLNITHSPIHDNKLFPTDNNPFMNVEITSYDKPPIYGDYNRYYDKTQPSINSENTKADIQQKFTNKLFQDASGYLFDRNNSQRQFYSVPVGSVPNKQSEFAYWLYGNQYNCKNGSIFSRYNLDQTKDSQMCNGYNVSVPTNFGLYK